MVRRRSTRLDCTLATTTLSRTGQHSTSPTRASTRRGEIHASALTSPPRRTDPRRHCKDGSFTTLSEFGSLAGWRCTASASVFPSGATAQASAKGSRSRFEPEGRKVCGLTRTRFTPRFGSRLAANPSSGPAVSFCGPWRGTCRGRSQFGADARTSAANAVTPIRPAPLMTRLRSSGAQESTLARAPSVPGTCQARKADSCG